MSFQDDIQGKNTQLFPIVEIDGDWYSTNNFSLKLEASFAGQTYTTIKYCKPILMNIPSIKESIDIESRKFKISNVSLQFNNFPFDGVRFSDQLSESSLINTEATIYFKSQSEGFDGLKEVYKGIIRRITHDDEKVSVELEDLTEQKAHKDLPKPDAYLGDGENVPDKYKNKPIPMVYGHVDRSPVVISEKISLDVEDESEYVSTLDIDTKELSGYQSSTYSIGDKLFSISPLYINVDDEYLNLKVASTIGDSDNFVSPDSNTIQFPSVSDSDFAVHGEVTVEIPRKVVRVSHSTTSYISAAPDLEIELIGIIDDVDFLGTGTYEIDPENAMLLMTDQNEDTSVELRGTVSDTFGQYMNVRFHLDNAPYDYECLTYLSVKIDAQAGNDAYWMILSGHSNEEINIDSTGLSTSDYDSYSGSDLASGRLLGDWDYVGVYSGFSIQIPRHVDHTYFQLEEQFDVKLRIVEAHLYQIAKIPNLIKNDFYVNVNGRRNSLDNHPIADGVIEGVGMFLENPIDIIYDLVRGELGHDAIDEAEYGEARKAHQWVDADGNTHNWKFGFTITKKINSKKLIEEIAKSTKCFPKFKNDGTFGFNTIKDNYTTSDFDADENPQFNDYANAHLIKESEVISYSFKKTKPEQIYQKVDVQYNKDYAQDSFMSRTEPALVLYGSGQTQIEQGGEGVFYNTTYYVSGDPRYYGIDLAVDGESDSYLEFESEYIREEETADALKEFLLGQHRNDRLIFNLKLPLQYINLEIGDLVKFEDLFQGLKAYGIDYRILDEVNGQHRYPLFMVTSTQKNLDSVSIECMQLHHLSGDIDTNWTNITFPDSAEVVIPEVVVDEGLYPNEGDQVEVPSGYYYFEESYPYDVLVFIKEDGVLLFDFTIYSFFSVGNLLRIRDDDNNVNEFEIFGINSDNSGSRLMLKPIDIEGFGELFAITSMSDSGDLLITELSWEAVYPLGDTNLDGGVDILDINILINHMLGIQPLTGQALIGADINQDDSIDILDVIGIVHIILGID